jgi:hypothetical protein
VARRRHARRPIGQIVQRHHAGDRAVDHFGARRIGEEQVHGAALVGFDVPEGDPAQVGMSMISRSPR